MAFFIFFYLFNLVLAKLQDPGFMHIRLSQAKSVFLKKVQKRQAKSVFLFKNLRMSVLSVQMLGKNILI